MYEFGGVGGELSVCPMVKGIAMKIEGDLQHGGGRRACTGLNREQLQGA
jgi:hypothetical protein